MNFTFSMIKRAIYDKIEATIGKNKVVIITGARRVGKTHLLENLMQHFNGKCVYLNGDLPETKSIISEKNLNTYERLIGKSRLLLIDEAQLIPDIGRSLKIIIDNFKELTVIATGSSSFDLVNKTGEPLTGRQLHFKLFPIAQMELIEKESLDETMRNLDERLIYGSYPEIFSIQEDTEKKNYLQEIASSYLLKDILLFEQVRNSNKMLQLLQLVAYQVGSEISAEELGKQLSLKRETVLRYLDLLSKIYVIYRVGAYSSNLRKEIVKSSKWYFVDNGIRNAVINNFSGLSSRNDIGALWENYLMGERIKRNAYNRFNINSYFWRNCDRQEIDLIEEADGQLNAFELKWKSDSAKVPIFFSKSYPKASFETVNRQNYLDFIT